MLGVMTAGAGIAIWITTGTIVGVAIATFGGVLLILGVVQHFLFRRDQEYWPEQAHLWNDGLELVLHNGEIRGASWSDPDFALQLVSRRAHAPIVREFMMIWLMDPKVPPVELTAQGYELLQQSAANRGLALTQSRKGFRPDSTQLVHIHPSAAVTAAARARGAESTGPG
jgi:hypothetical protein